MGSVSFWKVTCHLSVVSAFGLDISKLQNKIGYLKEILTNPYLPKKETEALRTAELITFPNRGSTISDPLPTLLLFVWFVFGEEEKVSLVFL